MKTAITSKYIRSYNDFYYKTVLTFNVEGSFDDLDGVATPVAAPVALVARLQVRHADRALRQRLQQFADFWIVISRIFTLKQISN